MLTISPELLDQLEHSEGTLERKLSPAKAKASEDEQLRLDEKAVRWMHNEDAIATQKLAEGIRKFNSDARAWGVTTFPSVRKGSIKAEVKKKISPAAGIFLTSQPM